VNAQNVQCVPKKAANSSCSNNYECLSNWCNINGTCTNYSWNSIPAGRDCFGGFCASGLYCNSSYICTAYHQQGDSCNFTSECLTDLQCIQNGTQRTCQRSPTIGKPCGWNSLGQHNCTVSFGESCVCFGYSTPHCVNVNSQEYLGRIQQSRQIVTSSVGNAQLVNNAAFKSSLCQISSLNFDSDYMSTLPSVISSSYLRNRTGCNFENTVPTLDDPVCRSLYAKYLCCNICSGLLDADLSLYPNLKKDDKMFYGLYFGPIYSLTCGANPNITVNKDTCNGANVLSYNDIVNQLQCGTSFQPSYGLLAFNISVFNPSSLTEEYIQLLILDFITMNGLPRPAVVSVTARSDIPFLYYVMIGYTGNSNNQTLLSLSNSLGGSNFTNHISRNNFVGASISAITTDNIFGSQFPSQPFPFNQSEPLPNNLSPEPFPIDISPEPLSDNPEPEFLPSTQPFPENLFPEPNPLIPTTPQPTTPTITPTITPTSAPNQQSPTAPTGFATKSIVVSLTMVITSIIIGLSF